MERDQPGVWEKLQSQTDELLRAHPNDFEALWRAARMKQWKADGETDMQAKAREGQQAWALGDRATQANPKAVQGYYYAALGIGGYSQGVGVLHALGEGLESKFNERLDTANKMDPNFESAGGLVAKGRYWYELPWPKRSLNKSKDTLEHAISIHPENLRAYVYLAESQLKDGDAKKAKATIQKALDGAVTYNPPEGRRAKLMAQPVVLEIQKELK